MASTCLNELGWHPDLIELQLAHAECNKVRAAYNRAQRLDERRKIMQAWGDYLNGVACRWLHRSAKDVRVNSASCFHDASVAFWVRTT